MTTIDERLMLVDRDETIRHKARFTGPGIRITTPSGTVFIIKVLAQDPPVPEGVNKLRMMRMYFTTSDNGHSKIHKSQMDVNLLRGMSKRQRVIALLKRKKLRPDR